MFPGSHQNQPSCQQNKRGCFDHDAEASEFSFEDGASASACSKPSALEPLTLAEKTFLQKSFYPLFREHLRTKPDSVVKFFSYCSPESKKFIKELKGEKISKIEFLNEYTLSDDSAFKFFCFEKYAYQSELNTETKIIALLKEIKANSKGSVPLVFQRDGISWFPAGFIFASSMIHMDPMFSYNYSTPGAKHLASDIKKALAWGNKASEENLVKQVHGVLDIDPKEEKTTQTIIQLIFQTRDEENVEALVSLPKFCVNFGDIHFLEKKIEEALDLIREVKDAHYDNKKGEKMFFRGKMNIIKLFHPANMVNNSLDRLNDKIEIFDDPTVEADENLKAKCRALRQTSESSLDARKKEFLFKNFRESFQIAMGNFVKTAKQNGNFSLYEEELGLVLQHISNVLEHGVLTDIMSGNLNSEDLSANLRDGVRNQSLFRLNVGCVQEFVKKNKANIDHIFINLNPQITVLRFTRGCFEELVTSFCEVSFYCCTLAVAQANIQPFHLPILESIITKALFPDLLLQNQAQN